MQLFAMVVLCYPVFTCSQPLLLPDLEIIELEPGQPCECSCPILGGCSENDSQEPIVDESSMDYLDDSECLLE